MKLCAPDKNEWENVHMCYIKGVPGYIVMWRKLDRENCEYYAIIYLKNGEGV